LTATNAPRNRLRMVSYAVPAYLLYTAHNSLYPLVTQKVSIEQNFRKGKIVSEFSQEHVFTRVVLNHPVH